MRVCGGSAAPPSAEGAAAEMVRSSHGLLLSRPSLLCRWRKTGEVGEVLALCISRRACQVLACDAAGPSLVWVDFPAFGLVWVRTRLQYRATAIVRLPKDGCHCRCSGWLPPLPGAAVGEGPQSVTLQPGRKVSCTRPKARCRGGGGPAWAAAPSPKCRSRDGCGFGVRRRSGDDTTSFPQWGGQQRGGGLRSLGLVGLAATHFTCLSQLLLLSGCAAVWGGDEGQALAQPLPCGRPRPTVPQWRREGDEARDLYRGRCVHSVPLVFCGAVEGTWGAWRPRKVRPSCCLRQPPSPVQEMVNLFSDSLETRPTFSFLWIVFRLYYE